MKIEYPPVGVRDVARYMWRGLRPDGWLSLATVFLFIVANVTDVFVPLLYKSFFDILSSVTDRSLAAGTLVSIIVFVLALRGTRWASRNLGLLGLQKLEPDTMARLRQMSFEYLMEHSYSFFTNNFTGSLIQRVNRMARSFERIADTIVLNFVPLAITTLGAIIVTWSIQPILAVVILVWVVVFFALNYIFAIWRVKYNIRMAAADSKTTGALADILTNQNSTLLFTALPSEVDYFGEITRAQARITKTTWNINSLFDASQALIIFFAEFAIFYFGIGLWEKNAITVGTFVLVQVYIIQLAGQLWDFGRIIRTVYEVFADSKEMVEILMLPHEVKDASGATALQVSKADIVFDHLTFGFEKGRDVLHDINLTIPGGQKVALVGPSGAGKTTFIRVLLRFYNVTKGRVLIDGQDI
ncbi:ABC transporter ATP-binding protein [Candidatus Kaiserbacteria bacterium]|nr:ABC transporter ATP-binding protein [Candidatus Kaiserbacteria bacterium]